MLHGTRDDPSINDVPELDDMQTFDQRAAYIDNESSFAPEGKVYGAGIEAE